MAGSSLIAAGEEEGTPHTCIPSGRRDRRLAGQPSSSAQSPAPGRQSSYMQGACSPLAGVGSKAGPGHPALAGLPLLGAGPTASGRELSQCVFASV